MQTVDQAKCDCKYTQVYAAVRRINNFRLPCNNSAGKWAYINIIKGLRILTLNEVWCNEDPLKNAALYWNASLDLSCVRIDEVVWLQNHTLKIGRIMKDKGKMFWKVVVDYLHVKRIVAHFLLRGSITLPSKRELVLILLVIIEATNGYRFWIKANKCHLFDGMPMEVYWPNKLFDGRKCDTWYHAVLQGAAQHATKNFSSHRYSLQDEGQLSEGAGRLSHSAWGQGFCFGKWSCFYHQLRALFVLLNMHPILGFSDI